MKGVNHLNRPLKIIIAEDDFLVLMGLRSNIEKLGHHVVAEASNGQKAIELVMELQPDLIIMDINMPIIDGIEAIKIINKKLFIPSIIVSAYHDDTLIKRATEEGVLYYLLKPVDITELSIAIKISLSRFEEIKLLQNDLKDTKKALEARKYIEKAKGILMDRKKLKEKEAMKHLQEISRNNNKKLVEVSKELINADTLFYPKE